MPYFLVNRCSLLAEKFSQLAQTLKYLKSRQLIYFFLRRMIKIPYSPVKIHGAAAANFQWSHQHRQLNCIQHQHFIFLNVRSNFSISDVQWRAKGYSKLWRYNLHYFDYLHTEISPDVKSHLISDWIDNNPYPCEDAWEPYTTSLRIINWIEYFCTLPPEHIHGSWLESLYTQGHYLTRHIEWHIDANHLLKNCIALVIWSHYFTGDFAKQWQSKSLEYFRRLCTEQFNSDGGHYERSPMYHNILLWHLLDVYGCITQNTNQDFSWLATVIKNALNYSEIMTLPDGRFPLLKDSAYGIAQTTAAIKDYASLLGLDYQPATSNLNSVYFLSSSGYAVYKNNDDFILLDVGNVTPSHQPGHAHCDALHLELVWDGRSILTDSGVYCYENGLERHNCRSVQAHNTACINGNEQHQIWGAFRIGARGTVTAVQVSQEVFKAEFTAFQSSSKQQICHKREVLFHSTESFSVIDTILGQAQQDIEIYWHLNIGLSAQIIDKTIEIYDEDLKLVTVIKLQHSRVIPSITTSAVYPEFGRRLQRSCIVINLKSEAPVEKIHCQFSKYHG